MLSLLEIVIAAGFFLKMFDSGGAFNVIVASFGDIFDWSQSGILTKCMGSDIGSLISALASVTGFMIFGFILITIVPGVINKKEKELDLHDNNFD